MATPLRYAEVVVPDQRLETVHESGKVFVGPLVDVVVEAHVSWPFFEELRILRVEQELVIDALEVALHKYGVLTVVRRIDCNCRVAKLQEVDQPVLKPMVAILRLHMDAVKLYVLAAVLFVPAPIISYEARSERQGVLSIITLKFALNNVGRPGLVLTIQHTYCRLVTWKKLRKWLLRYVDFPDLELLVRCYALLVLLSKVWLSGECR